MRRRRLGLHLAAWLVAAVVAHAQSTPAAATPAPAPTVPPAAAEAETDPTLPDPAVQQNSLLTDIRGASYYELVAWCRELGLEDTGDRKQLQDRLVRHYGLVAGAPTEEKPVRVEIVRAKETDYFTVEEVGEDYVILRGGVVVKVTDDDGQTIHTIEADELTYNRTTSTMTARGGARYVQSKGGKEEVFEGESLSFDTENLSGVFYNGSVVRERTVSGRALTFTFRGRSLSRLENDTVILEDATITSSKPVDPYYSVVARKAWILGEGEWALQGATLRVGRIPVFYLPFFFLPGDQLIFHPSIEVRPREGTVLQTTTYLLGQLKRTADPLSLLRLSEEEPGAGYRRVPRGLFLTLDPDDKTPVKDVDRYVTLMVDVYTRLGAMVGIDAKLPPEFSGRLGLGVSRSIFPDPASGFTPYWRDPVEGYISILNHSTVAGLSLPFRFGVESKIELKPSILSLAGALEYYSDPYFPVDFYNRKQGLQLDQLLNAAAVSSTAPTQKTNLTWSAKAAANFGPLLKTPLASELAVRALETTAFLSSRDVVASDPLTSVDPGRSFYYPVRLKLPGLALGLRGTLLKLPAATPAQTPEPAQTGTPPAAGQDHGDRILLPGQEPAATETAGPPAQGDSELVVPTTKADTAVALPGGGATLELSYAAAPVLEMEHLFAEAGWLTPQDVGLDTTATTLAARSDFTLKATVGLAGQLIALGAELNAAASYRTRYPGSEPPADAVWDAQLLTDYQATTLKVGEKATVTLKPLLGVDALKTSSLVYTFGWQFLGVGLRAGTLAGEAPVFETITTLDADTVTEHSLKATLVAQPGADTQTITLTAVLPPEVVSLKGQLGLAVWKLKLGLNASVKLDEGTWVPDPLSGTLSFQPWSWLTLSQDAQLTLDPLRVSRLGSTVKAGDFSGTLTAAWMAPVDPYGVPTGEPEALLASRLQLQYTLPSAKLYFWKDRIQLERQLTLGWDWNLQQYTMNELTLGMKLSLTVYRFLTFSFSARSHNSRMYLYVPAHAEALGLEWVNPVYDLIRSFNFFDESDRYLSAFKVRDLSISATHHMQDWDLKVEYTGKPALKTDEDGTRSYVWDRSFSIQLEWAPLPVLRARASGDTTGFALRR